MLAWEASKVLDSYQRAVAAVAGARQGGTAGGPHMSSVNNVDAKV